MNDEIELMFKNFTVKNKKIPVEFMNYTGKEETYVTYISLGETPELHADNEAIASINTYDFDIYTKGNFLPILRELKKILKANKWRWQEDSEDMYEEDTRYFHKVTTWSIEGDGY